MLNRKPPSLKARALQALALREHSRRELEQKLLRGARRPAAPRCDPDRGNPAVKLAEPPEPTDSATAALLQAQVHALLDELEAQGLLSEDRFVESRVHARESRFGNRRIEAELAQHGLQLNADAAAELRHTEFERARAVWARRYGSSNTGSGADDPPSPATPPTPAELARQMRFLAARGFSADVIRRVVKGGAIEE